MNRREILLSASAATIGLGSNLATAQTDDPGDPMTGDDPMRAAEYLSSLESNNYIPTLYVLYSYIHPDAAETVPRATVIGWYQEDFLPRGPQPAIATDVTWLDSWTWEVTGQTYSDVAEVSFTQEFADGSTVEDVVRLVYHDGAWRWWFGRDAAFVEEQNARFSLVDNVPQEGNAPFELETISSLDESILEHLPALIEDAEFDGSFELAQSAGSFNPDGIREPMHLLLYKPLDPPHEFELGSIEYGSVVDSTTNEDDLLRFADFAQNAPPVEFIGWNTEPESGPSWLQTENAGVDVVGTSYRMTLVMDGNYLLIQMFTEESLGIVCGALTNRVSQDS